MTKQMILTVTVMKLDSKLKTMMTMLAQANLAQLLFP